MQRAFQAAAWLLALAIVALSLVPPSYRPTSDITSQSFEHLAIFLALGTAFGLGYTNRFWILAGALVTFSGGIEIAQLWAPGRHARLSDFFVDAAASCIGIGLSRAFLKLRDATVKR
jgi:VanZ family protein